MTTSVGNVYKILRAQELAGLVVDGAFAGSPDDRRDGFIHLCERVQIVGTLEKHFSGHCALYLAALARGLLVPHLRLEPSRGGSLFPHLYRPLVVTDVAWIRPIPDADRPRWCDTLSRD